MKVKIEGGSVILAPECAEDHAAIHQIRGVGIRAMQILNSIPQTYGPGLRGPLVLELHPGNHALEDSPLSLQELALRLTQAQTDLAQTCNALRVVEGNLNSFTQSHQRRKT